MYIASEPKRGDVITEDGKAKEFFAIWMSQITESNNQDNPKNNFTATGVPTISNNASEGFIVGSRWIFADIVYTLTSFTGADATWTALN